jgi:hypothetical protein
VYDELGTFHDGASDVNGDGEDDDDHDVLTGSLTDGTYGGFSCDDWTSTTATPSGQGNGLRLGHIWPANSGQNWQTVHNLSTCGAGTNFIQDGGPDDSSVGSGGGYGAFYCFAIE